MACDCLVDQIKPGLWLPSDGQPAHKGPRHQGARDPAGPFAALPVLLSYMKMFFSQEWKILVEPEDFQYVSICSSKH